MLKLFSDLKPEARFVAFLALLIILTFLSVSVISMFFPIHPDADIKQTMIAIVMLAVGFYFGSSSSSRAKDATLLDQVQPKPDAPAPAPEQPAAPAQ